MLPSTLENIDALNKTRTRIASCLSLMLSCTIILFFGDDLAIDGYLEAASAVIHAAAFSYMAISFAFVLIDIPFYKIVFSNTRNERLKSTPWSNNKVVVVSLVTHLIALILITTPISLGWHFDFPGVGLLVACFVGYVYGSRGLAPQLVTTKRA